VGHIENGKESMHIRTAQCKSITFVIDLIEIEEINAVPKSGSHDAGEGLCCWPIGMVIPESLGQRSSSKIVKIP
jgi:hypothetical protein